MSDENLPAVPQSRTDVVYSMRLKGLQPADIADELHITLAEVNRCLKEKVKQEASFVPDEEREGLLALENARLDYYLSKLWPEIEYGDTKAIHEALNIANLRMKLNQMDKMVSTQTNNVLVVGGDSQNYIAALRAMRGDD